MHTKTRVPRLSTPVTDWLFLVAAIAILLSACTEKRTTETVTPASPGTPFSPPPVPTVPADSPIISQVWARQTPGEEHALVAGTASGESVVIPLRVDDEVYDGQDELEYDATRGATFTPREDGLYQMTAMVTLKKNISRANDGSCLNVEIVTPILPAPPPPAPQNILYASGFHCPRRSEYSYVSSSATVFLTADTPVSFNLRFSAFTPADSEIIYQSAVYIARVR